MPQELRKTHRHPLTLSTEVHYKEPGLRGMFRCHTENISMIGVYLPSGELPLEKDVGVELVISAKSAPVAKSFHLSAYAVRSSDAGVGPPFSAMTRETRQEFRRSLLEAKAGAHY